MMINALLPLIPEEFLLDPVPLVGMREGSCM
jgi:hypothetical protein